jgi:hypothetical protein
MIVVAGQPAVRAPFSRTARPIFQNLGPGNLFFFTSANNVATNGIKLPVNAVYELPTALVLGAGEVWFVAVSENCDVRIVNVG